jgi:CheY-like chemotaxis protein
MEVDANDGKRARLRLNKEVLINNSVKGYALEISEADMLLSSPAPFPKGKTIDLSFTFAEGQPPILMQAFVQSVQEGVEFVAAFTDISPVDKERLKKYIEENLPAQPVKKQASTDGETRKKLLLVDDSVTARATYKNKLVLSGYLVSEASSGMEAIKAITEDIPALIVLDMQMEGMDGTKFLQFLRSNEAWKKVKVIMLSGRITPKETDAIVALGVSDILSKMTTTPNKLAAKVRQMIGS